MAFSGEVQRFEADSGSLEADNLRGDLIQLFAQQADKSLIVFDPSDPSCPAAVYLRGSMPSEAQKKYVLIDIVGLGIGEEDGSATISVDPDQFLVGADGIRRADRPAEKLSEVEILELRSWLQPGRVLWSKSLSRVLANSPLGLSMMLPRPS